MRLVRPRLTGVPAGGGGGLRIITHGDQLLTTDVGPWALQNVAKGSEVLGSGLTVPPRGYWRTSESQEFVPQTAWPSNANDANPAVLNDPSLRGGIVTGSPVTIDGYTIPVGTNIVQFTEFPDSANWYAQGETGKYLFRGCRIRFTSGVDGVGLVNDYTAPTSFTWMMHFCDIGLLTLDPPTGSEGLMHVKNIGGQGHRYLRNYHTRSGTFYQPNNAGDQVLIEECWIEEFIFVYGYRGTSGGTPGNATMGHLNGISSEGGRSNLTVRRNHILAASPDGATGSGTTAAGQVGYGTQPGQDGYGSGTNPGRLVNQTDCIALFAITAANTGATIQGNYLGGTGYVIYAGNADGAATNIAVNGNTITTRYWTDGGSYGPIADQPPWGSNGNVQSNNLWADDYGTGGDGSTALANRQYPTGSGPRAGTSFI